MQRASDYPYLDAQALPDVACVALNRMGPRYIRHAVDLTFNGCSFTLARVIAVTVCLGKLSTLWEFRFSGYGYARVGKFAR
ncbi:MAG: late competence development ComFB family protein [Gammaproteobacteria bacterium]